MSKIVELKINLLSGPLRKSMLTLARLTMEDHERKIEKTVEGYVLVQVSLEAMIFGKQFIWEVIPKYTGGLGSEAEEGWQSVCGAVPQ